MKLCSDRNPRNRGMTCSLPPGHASPHAMGDGATWTLRLPETETLWAVQHITQRGPVTDYHQLEQDAHNQWTHLIGSRVAAIYYQTTIITDTGEAA